MARRLSLPDHAAALVSLPLSSGGTYRPWKSHADCAFLASYMHTAHHFPKLLLALAHHVPPILDLVPATARRHHHPLSRPPWQLELSFGSLHRPRWCEIGLRAGQPSSGTRSMLSQPSQPRQRPKGWFLSSRPWTGQACRATWSSTTPTAATPSASPWSPPTLQQRPQTKSSALLLCHRPQPRTRSCVRCRAE